MNAAETARVRDEVRRQVFRAYEQIRATQRQVLDLHDQVRVVGRRVSGAEATIRSLQSVDDPAGRRNIGRDVATEMEVARSHGRRAYMIGLEVTRDLHKLQSSLAEVKHDIDTADRQRMSPQDRVDMTVLASRVDNMAWSVALAVPAAASVTESMLYAEDRARVITEQALTEVPPLKSPAVFEEITKDLNRAVEGEAHLQSATSDSLRLAEAVTEHSELVAEAAHARMAGEQQRDLPGAFPGSSSVGPQW